MVIESSNFDFNRAREKGGVIYVDGLTTLTVSASNFTYNTVENDGGVMALLGGSQSTIQNCSFTGNSATSNGGVIGILDSHADILNSTFCLSMAGSTGGVMHAINSSVVFNNTTFISNSVNSNGGVMDARMSSNIKLIASYLFNNSAKKSGGVLYVEQQSNAEVYNSTFHLNMAKSHGGVVSVTTASNINVTKTIFSQNTAEKGAAISVRKESSIFFDDDFGSSALFKDQSSAEGLLTQIYNNTADLGGGIYLIDSTLYFETGAVIGHNLAHGSGGGVHAFNSSIVIGSTINFYGNQATSGGGVSLASSKLYSSINDDTRIDVNFVSNYATDNGGALYVEDEVEGTCSSDSYSNNSGCFFQNLTNSIVLNFNDNYADSSGHDLFGGLLDRCSFVSNTIDPFMSDSNGVSRFKELSNFQNITTVSSGPVRVCPCKNGEPDCSKQQQSIQIRRGDGVVISIVATDQVNQPVTAVIQSSFNDTALPESQTIRQIGSNCTTVDYDVSFPNVGETHQLIIFAEGPCDDKGISKFVVDVEISSCVCPLGFMPAGRNSSGCSCDCDRRLSEYISQCDFSTKSVIRQGLFWITYLNNSGTDDFFIYPYCPLDYCQPPSNPIHVNLNIPQGSDIQCGNNHHGILCGSCQPGYSLSLGGSKCTKCPSNWYGFFNLIIISSLMAGIVLVVILLVLNLTVAIGTINAIIFYANIVYSNRRVYFGQLNLTFVPVFISWLNLDIGIDTCFFEGMDAYAKTWLQLAFPMYIIFLVFMIIWVSSCSSKFSRLLGKRDPVATLATLILLSYTKLLETIITTFSFATFRYSNHTTSLRWLPDANVEFGRGKHVGLICVAILILVLCLVYTTLILMWQWFLHCSRSKLFKWTGNHKLHAFINTYHTPHNAKHRYWTGMLLFVRVIVYIITAVSASSDQPITPLSTVAIMCCLLLYKTALLIRVYKNWLLNSTEVFIYFNIAIFALITSYTVANPPSQNKETLHITFAYLSVGATLILFIIVIAYHTYRYGCSNLYSLGKITKFSRKIRYKDQSDHGSLSVNDILDAIDNPRAKSGGATIPTRTVVSLTNCEESTAVATPPNQPITLGEYSSTVVQSEQDNNGFVVNAFTDRNFISKSAKEPMQFQGAAKRPKPKLLYYSTEHHITKPLLDDEDNL
jgi:predicted outer membrane repeat protein